MRRDKAVKAGTNGNQRSALSLAGWVIPYAGQNRHRSARPSLCVIPRNARRLCVDITREYGGGRHGGRWWTPRAPGYIGGSEAVHSHSVSAMVGGGRRRRNGVICERCNKGLVWASGAAK